MKPLNKIIGDRPKELAKRVGEIKSFEDFDKALQDWNEFPVSGLTVGELTYVIAQRKRLVGIAEKKNIL